MPVFVFVNQTHHTMKCSNKLCGLPLQQFPIRRGVQAFCSHVCANATHPEIAPLHDPGNVYFQKPKEPLNFQLQGHSDAPFEAEGVFGGMGGGQNLGQA